MAKRQLKNLLIFRFPGFKHAEEAATVNNYVREHPAARDFHIMVISEPGIDHLTIEEFGATRANGSDLRRLKEEIEDRLHLMGFYETMCLLVNTSIEAAKEKNALMKERAKMIQEQNRENNPGDFTEELKVYQIEDATIDSVRLTDDPMCGVKGVAFTGSLHTDGMMFGQAGVVSPVNFKKGGE